MSCLISERGGGGWETPRLLSSDAREALMSSALTFYAAHSGSPPPRLPPSFPPSLSPSLPPPSLPRKLSLPGDKNSSGPN